MMPRVTRAGYILPGDNRVIDKAGWQCTAFDSAEEGRCRWLATHVHRRRNGDKGTTVVALCQTHYELAGPEMAVRS